LRKSLFWPRLVCNQSQDANSDPDYCQEGTAVTDFDIFLSHNSTDKALVEAIAQKLQSKGLNPWLDKWCLVPGLPWQLQLATILRSCPTFGVFVGQNGLGDWAREELLVAQDRAAKERGFRMEQIGDRPDILRTGCSPSASSAQLPHARIRSLSPP
jgi:hypothetical protein